MFTRKGNMSGTKLFRKEDLDLEPVNGMKTIGLVNTSFSKELGGGIGVFEDCSIPWNITYDEIIYILDGQFTLRVGDEVYNARAGDVLWIPRDTEIVYEAQERVTFFYSVFPAGNAPSTSKLIDYASKM
jgi:ethanolamine utilization protein EutQ